MTNEVKTNENVKDVEEVQAIETEKGTKVKAFIKKHGKKIVAATAIGAIGLIGYALGHRTNLDAYSDDIVDGEYTELDDKNDEE